MGEPQTSRTAGALLRELGQELRAVLGGRGSVIDSVAPPVIFMLLNGLFGLPVALWGALGVAVVLMALRLACRQSAVYALAGVGGVGLAIGLALALGSAEGYFLPGLLSGVLTTFIAVISVLARRPMVAWTSFLARRWPLAWYWHPRVRPAYAEVTWLWALFFAARAGLQFVLLRAGSATALGTAQLLMGWPLTILLLVISYVYGIWRLRRLGGPSVDEFRRGAAPPWTGQRRGF